MIREGNLEHDPDELQLVLLPVLAQHQLAVVLEVDDPLLLHLN